VVSNWIPSIQGFEFTGDFRQSGASPPEPEPYSTLSYFFPEGDESRVLGRTALNLEL
jgi:hypothetical protein